ncbi:hypothetical protein ACI48D_24875, partial [Massilia sp. LXY-6]|uniref:hypothetical protein n=1 Tax=Massilia sp. LXY-6 TaxID=3379823 RepID=UPI003EDF7FE9
PAHIRLINRRHAARSATNPLQKPKSLVAVVDKVNTYQRSHLYLAAFLLLPLIPPDSIFHLNLVSVESAAGQFPSRQRSSSIHRYWSMTELNLANGQDAGLRWCAATSTLTSMPA